MRHPHLPTLLPSLPPSLNTASFFSFLADLVPFPSLSQLNQNQAIATPKIPWVLTKDEKKNYDQIFRAWDQSGSGFISGEVAQEVFGQSGLSRDDMAKIW